MPTKAMTLPEAEVTEADVLAALREYDQKVAVIQERMAERDKEYERWREDSRARTARIEKLLAR